jgi:cation diffusion facilitator CzcD-associated flavoprotein CzcO
MYTLGYAFRPWTGGKAIADGPSILAYVKETAEAYGIDRKIRYGHRVERLSWSTEDARWTLDVVHAPTGETRRLTAGFVFMCAGYYEYAHGYTPEFPGRDRFKGRVVHPQAWTDDVAYEGKRVVVVGSGATAVTLVPTLAEKAAHVTMLQRSPTYIVSVPAVDPVARWARARLPERAAYAAVRWKNIGVSMATYALSRRFPERTKKLLVRQVGKALRSEAQAAEHFTPTYDPWDQRVCLVPDGDLFDAVRSGRASVVTDHVETFTETGIRLRSGRELEADLVVTATGLQLKFLGGAEVVVDGARVEPSRTLAYKAMMLSDVPNLAMAVGYTNASWTLKCDLTSEYVCRLLRHMDDHGHAWCAPRRNDPTVKEEPILDFSSGYVRRSIDRFPRQGSVAPWRVHQNYARDVLAFRRAPLEDGVMEFGGRAAP